jgi:hypothetical protein
MSTGVVNFFPLANDATKKIPHTLQFSTFPSYDHLTALEQIPFEDVVGN